MKKSVSGARFSALVLLCALSSGCSLVARPVDVYYRAGYILSHLGDSRAIPPGANLCMETFCTRVDTKKKFAGGRKGYTSQAYYNYCPAHEPGFVNTNSRLDSFLRYLYWGATFLIAWIALLMLSLSPLAVIDSIRKKRHPDQTGQLVATCAPFAAYGTGAINLAVWLLFALY